MTAGTLPLVDSTRGFFSRDIKMTPADPDPIHPYDRLMDEQIRAENDADRLHRRELAEIEHRTYRILGVNAAVLAAFIAAALLLPADVVVTGVAAVAVFFAGWMSGRSS